MLQNINIKNNNQICIRQLVHFLLLVRIRYNMKISYFKYDDYYKIKSHEDLQLVSEKTGISLHALKHYNKLQKIDVGDMLLIPKSNVYFVKPLDTIEKIAKKLNISCEEIKRKNNIKNVFIGQILYF